MNDKKTLEKLREMHLNKSREECISRIETRLVEGGSVRIMTGTSLPPSTAVYASDSLFDELVEHFVGVGFDFEVKCPVTNPNRRWFRLEI